MRRLIKNVAVLCAVALASVAPVQAAAVYTLDTSGNSSTNGTYGNARTYSFGAGADAVNVRVTGWSLNSSMTSINSSYLGRWDAGFGVTSDGDNNGAYPLHALDNAGGRYDFIVFQFDKAVDVESFYVTPYSYNYKKDSDVTYGFGMDDTPWNSSLFSGTSNIPVSQLTGIVPFASFVNDDTTSNNPRTVTTAGGAGNVWIIGARFSSQYKEEYDVFKLDKIKFSVVPPPAVPEPATWAMMILGFGAIGVGMRRRRADVAALA